MAHKVSRKNKREVVKIPKMIRNLVKVEVIRPPQILILHILVVETEIDKIGIEKTKGLVSVTLHNQEKGLASSTIIFSLMKRSRIMINPEQVIKISTEMDANERPIKV